MLVRGWWIGVVLVRRACGMGVGTWRVIRAQVDECVSGLYVMLSCSLMSMTTVKLRGCTM